jgi:hypothetical protein
MVTHVQSLHPTRATPPPRPPLIPNPPLPPAAEWPSPLIRFLVDRDGPFCWLCNGDVFPSDVGGNGTGPKDYSPTTDHVRPKVQGGGNERTNLRLAHYFCNNLRTSETPHEGWRRVREFARKRDPELIRYNEAPAKNAEMPPPTKPVPHNYLQALAKMQRQQADASSRRIHKTQHVRDTALSNRTRLRDGLPISGKDAAALIHASMHWQEVVEPLTNEELIACLTIMSGDKVIGGVPPVWAAFAKAKGICGLCDEHLSLYVKGEARPVEWLDGRAYHSYCVTSSCAGYDE